MSTFRIIYEAKKMSDYSSKIGVNISKARKALQLSQNEIAQKLNCKQSVISRIENGGNIGEFFFKYLIFLKQNNVDLNGIFSVDP